MYALFPDCQKKKNKFLLIFDKFYLIPHPILKKNAAQTSVQHI